MNRRIDLKTVLTGADRIPEQQVALFAILNLGVLKSLTNSLMTATDALQVFFHGENCQFVRQQFHDRLADEIMSRGVQLADLFDVLPVEEAQREYQRELAKMRSLCLSLLEEKQLAA